MKKIDSRSPFSSADFTKKVESGSRPETVNTELIQLSSFNNQTNRIIVQQNLEKI